MRKSNKLWHNTCWRLLLYINCMYRYAPYMLIRIIYLVTLVTTTKQPHSRNVQWYCTFLSPEAHVKDPALLPQQEKGFLQVFLLHPLLPQSLFPSSRESLLPASVQPRTSNFHAIAFYTFLSFTPGSISKHCCNHPYLGSSVIFASRADTYLSLAYGYSLDALPNNQQME